MTRSSICCVIPGYNVEKFCGEVVRQAAAHADHVIAVDDGSTDGTGKILSRIAAESGGRVRFLSFAKNQGKGAALLEGFHRALAEFPFEVLVTLDGDGQHRAEEIPRLAGKCLEEGASLVIGERRETRAMPFRSSLGNGIMRALLRALYPGSPFDTQSGLRAHHRSFVEEVVRVVRGGRYETEIEILLLALRQGRRIGAVPIPTIYFDGNRSSHFRPLADSFRICRTILGSRRLPRGESRAGEPS